MCIRDSVWANPTQFYLDKDLNPIEVAGCPPDAFSADGQLWGNPLFRWDVMKKDSYSWWTKRISAMAKLYDIVPVSYTHLTFDEKPDGLESVASGDKVTVKYTGTISEVDPFDGKIISVEKAE